MWCVTDLGSTGDTVTVVESVSFSGRFSGIDTKLTLNEARVERGLAWDAAETRMLRSLDVKDGFFVSNQVRGSSRFVGDSQLSLK